MIESPAVVRLDAADVIVSANASWLASARRNDAADLTEAAVPGRPFSDFVADRQTLELYRLVFRRVRRTGETIRVPFRCDSPDERRHMEMEVVALEGGGLECRTHTVLVESRRGPAHARDPEARGAKPFLTLCSWCKKVKLPEGSWVEVEAAAQRLEFFLGEAPELTHGICPECKTALQGSLVFAK